MREGGLLKYVGEGGLLRYVREGGRLRYGREGGLLRYGGGGGRKGGSANNQHPILIHPTRGTNEPVLSYFRRGGMVPTGHSHLSYIELTRIRIREKEEKGGGS